jgi:hypothetical protein
MNTTIKQQALTGTSPAAHRPFTAGRRSAALRSALRGPTRQTIAAPAVLPGRPDGDQALTPYPGLRPRMTFRGTEQGAAAYVEVRTPGRRSRRAVIGVNQATADKIRWLALNADFESYQADPETYERNARLRLADAAPELMGAIALAKARDAVMTEIHGLPVPATFPATPLGGVVDEREVRSHVANLVGGLAGGWGLTGFAYQSENQGKLLRAVCPVKALAETASSQGYAAELVWHQDNANRAIAGIERGHPGHAWPINPFQGFVAVRPIAPRMEAVALADVIDETVRRHGADVADRLQTSDFAVNKPDSHGGGRDVEGVPVLIRGDDGAWHGRFHAADVVGLSPASQEAMRLFTEVVTATRTRVEFRLDPGSLLLYSNTRCMHRRSSYSAKLDGRDRYFIRLYLMSPDLLREYAAKTTRDRVFI